MYTPCHLVLPFHLHRPNNEIHSTRTPWSSRHSHLRIHNLQEKPHTHDADSKIQRLSTRHNSATHCKKRLPKHQKITNKRSELRHSQRLTPDPELLNKQGRFYSDHPTRHHPTFAFRPQNPGTPGVEGKHPLRASYGIAGKSEDTVHAAAALR